MGSAAGNPPEARLYAAPIMSSDGNEWIPVDVPGEGPVGGRMLVFDTSSASCFAVGFEGAYEVAVGDSPTGPFDLIRMPDTWFEDWETWVGPQEGPPLPRLKSIHYDCDRRQLWLLSYVANDVGFRPLEGGTQMMGRTHDTYDTLVEVVDVDTLRILARQRFEGMLGLFLSGRRVLEPFVTDVGEQGFRVLVLGL
jgi:hypothetical protein